MRCLLSLAILSLPLITFAQFNSGSTGADGALDTSQMDCPNFICEVQLPESGVLNYTTFTVTYMRGLRFKRNSRNTAVTILTQGDAVIDGRVSVESGQFVGCTTTPSRVCFEPKLGGPGGFAGSSNGNGFGPGGGVLGAIQYGRWVGPLSLVPLVGGSGAAGTLSRPGTGGAGAILIASSTRIWVRGAMSASQTPEGINENWELGSGGAIRLLSNTIIVSGTLEAYGDPFSGTATVGDGVIRLESTSLTFTGNSRPMVTVGPINPTVIPSQVPLLTISSIGGYAVPSNSGQRLDWTDLLLPTQLPEPVSVVVSAQNIPPGTQVQVGFVSGSPNGTSIPCGLAGTLAGSSCTATVSNLSRTGATYILATAAFSPPASVAAFNPRGKNRVAKVRLESVLGGGQKYVFLRKDGSAVEQKALGPKFLREFGL